MSYDTLTTEGRNFVDGLIDATIGRRDGIINHFRDEDAVAKALATALLGDDVEWRQHQSLARRFLDAMERSLPPHP